MLASNSQQNISLSDLSPTQLDIENGYGETGKQPTRPFHYARSDSSDTDDLDLTLDATSRLHWAERPRIPMSRRLFGDWRWRRGDLGPLEKRPSKRRSRLRLVLRTLATALMFLGVVQLISLFLALSSSLWSDEFVSGYGTWDDGGNLQRQSRWPTDYTAEILPVACHSHNDYWRRIPLRDAIMAGCTGVEADVWLLNDDLFVGHNRASLTNTRTLKSLYVDPLVELLENQNPTTPLHPTLDIPRNGVFDTVTSQTLVLLIDFKTDGAELWPVVQSQLEPLRSRNYLSFFNGTEITEGPITIVVTGNAPFDHVVANATYRDMFFDAPLDLMARLDPPSSSKSTAKVSSLTGRASSSPSDQGQGQSGSAPTEPAVYSRANSYYTSVSFHKSIGMRLPWLTNAQVALIRKQVAGAHAQGLKVRYWDVPAWPRGLRNYLWKVLVNEGVDYLNVDDLKGATRGQWKTGLRIGLLWSR